ncbi:ABC transporter ATP-binding protein [Nonomuraea rubra]
MRSFDPETSASPSSSVLRLLRPGPGAAAALAAAIAAATALPLAAPQVTRRFVDDAIGGASIRHLTLVALGYLALAVAGQAARMVTAWLAGRLAWDGTNRLRERLTGHALGLDLAFHGRHTPGELIERVDGDVVAVADFVVAFLLDVVASVLLLAGVVVVVFAVDWRIGAALLAYCLIVGYGMARAQRLAVPSAARARAASATLFGTLEERFAGAEDIRANGAGEHTVRRFHQVAAALFRAENRDARIGTTLLAGTSVAFAAGTAVMLALAAWTVETGTLTVGTAVLLFQYTLMVRAPFERLIDQIRQYQAALAGLARIAALLAERPAADPRHRARCRVPGRSACASKASRFSYPDDGRAGAVRHRRHAGARRDAGPGRADGQRQDHPGQARAAAGTTPSRAPSASAGVDLREPTPARLRARIGVVTQDVQLFAASVRDNLTLFRPSPGDERLMEVLQAVGLDEWAAGLPDGLDTELRGLSAGQGQLLAFARAFLAIPGSSSWTRRPAASTPPLSGASRDSVGRLLEGRTA